MSNEVVGGKSGVTDPDVFEVLSAVGLALTCVAATRLPFARVGPVESDEWQFVKQMDAGWLPAHHTLFQTAGRAIGMLVGGHYRGLVVLDMLVSALALACLWWWLRALVRPPTAAACTVAVGVSPLFWSLGEMAGNYTMIPLVGSILLGVAYRGLRSPRPWHPYASAVVLAVGTGYREDIGTYLLPLFAVIAWQHRWKPAIGALALFTALNLAWLLPMLHEAGGWDAWRARSAEFAYSAGFKNSIWNLGLVDAPVRYSIKMALAMVCTLGPGLVFVPRGLIRLGSMREGTLLAGLLALGVAPALGSHLLVHFGVAGYGFHYLPAMAALLAIGIGRVSDAVPSGDLAPLRLASLAGLLAAAFLFYPADVERDGWRGDVDLAVGRYTRSGLHSDVGESGACDLEDQQLGDDADPPGELNRAGDRSRSKSDGGRPCPGGLRTRPLRSSGWRRTARRLEAPRTSAMNARTGVTLRLLGPLIEVGCLILLLRWRDQGRQVLGVPIEYPLYTGLALGLALVVVGLLFSRPAPRRPRDPGRRDLP